MTYDQAGNLINDTYTGQGTRTYDAENRMKQAWANDQWQTYVYDGDGKRIKRIVNGVETWQIYGFTGELLAEYAANAAASSPQKEYGYRNGELLITADGRTNVALAANGGVASASSAHTCCGFSVGGAINGNVRGPWSNGEGWNDATPNELPDWFQVDFSGSKTIDEIDVFSLHDDYTHENSPTETQTFSLYGLVNFEVQYWNGSAWVTIPSGSVSNNNKVCRKFTFSALTTSKIRLWITGVPDSWSRLVELQAWEAGTTGAKLNWLVTDQLGTPRMVFDQTGSLANVSRHDYLPFGEELYAGTGGRMTGQGYTSSDGVRQKFTGYERDAESGLDYAHARYFASAQGRFTSPDPLARSAAPANPQTFNRYTYVNNSPLTTIDPLGMFGICPGGGQAGMYVGGFTEKSESTATGAHEATNEVSDGAEAADRQQEQQSVSSDSDVTVEVAVDPCRDMPHDEKIALFNRALRQTGLGISIDDSDRLSNPEQRSSGSMFNVLRNAGWSRFFTNLNPAHAGGSHLEKEFDTGKWLHIVITPAERREDVAIPWRGGVHRTTQLVTDWTLPPRLFEMHCERGFLRPSSMGHGLDYIKELTIDRIRRR